MVEFPLRPRVVQASDDIDGARGCVAFERGPLVYCVEGHDLASEHPLGDISVLASVPKEEPGLDIGGQQVVALKLQGQARSTGTPPWPYFDAGSEAGETRRWCEQPWHRAQRWRPRGARHSLLCLGQQGRDRYARLGAGAPLSAAATAHQERARGTGQTVWRSLTSRRLRKGFPSCFQVTLT